MWPEAGSDPSLDRKDLLMTHITARLILGLAALLMAALTVPAYFNPSINPALASLPTEFQALGSTAGLFLGRQLTLILIALYAAAVGGRLPLLFGGFAMTFLNGHDAVLAVLFDGETAAAVAGAILALAGIVVLFLANRLQDKP